MKRNRSISAMVLGAALAIAPTFAWAQDTSARQDMRNAGHETKDAARDAGHGVKKGTKHAYRATKRGTKKAWRKTRNTTSGAINGGREGAHEPTNPQ